MYQKKRGIYTLPFKDLVKEKGELREANLSSSLDHLVYLLQRGRASMSWKHQEFLYALSKADKERKGMLLSRSTEDVQLSRHCGIMHSISRGMQPITAQVFAALHPSSHLSSVGFLRAGPRLLGLVLSVTVEEY